jgi:Ca2+/Na+ antiporter
VSLISWSGNIGDCINASIAAKMNKVDLLTTGILASQIMNLQICIGIPWLIYMIIKSYSDNNNNNIRKLFIDFGKEKINKLFIPTLITVFISVFVMFLFKRRLNKISGFILFIIYVVYFIYLMINSKE